MNADAARERGATCPDEPDGHEPGAGEPHVAPGTMSALLEELVQAGAPPQPGPELEPGDRLGRFEIVRELGRGGFGVVYEARDASLRRSVAVKVLRRATGERAASALVEEAEAAAQLQHPNIVALHDVGAHEGQPYVVMELLRGETLSERLERGPVPRREAIEIAEQIARGLAHAHARGVVHRDLAPGNVFLCDGGTVKLLDFGLSRLLGGDARAGGTPGYAAPEQWTGGVQDARVDVFALGVIVHRMVTGELPYPDGALRSPDLQRAPTTPGLPRGVAALARRALAADQRARPANGQAILDAFARVRRRAVRLRWATALGVLVVLAMALAWKAPRRARQPAEPPLVAVADVVNDTGDPDLDAISGLLITSLEQSRRVRVMTRARMFDVMKQLGMPEAARPDERAAREVARKAGVTALLVSTVRRFGDVYSVETKALDPTHDEYLLTAKVEGRGKESVPGLLDDLAERVRVRMREPHDEARGSSIEIGGGITPNLDAYRHYFAAQEVLAHWRSWDDLYVARAELLKALELDPAFTLARFELARVKGIERGPKAEIEEILQDVKRGARGLPDKERRMLRAFDADFHNDIDAAAELYRDVVERYPDDKWALFYYAWVLWYRYDRAALRPAERAVALDPDFRFAKGLLLEIQLSSMPAEEVVDFWRRRADASPTAARLKDLTLALGGAARFDEAVEVARRAGNPRVLAAMLYLADRYPEADAVLQSQPGTTDAALNRAVMRIAEGRFGDGDRMIRDALAAGGTDIPFRGIRDVLLFGAVGSRERFRVEARRACADHAQYCATCAFLAATRRELGLARECLARVHWIETELPREIAVAAENVYSLLATGNAREAAATARRLERRSESFRMYAGLILGDACFAGRDFACALAGYDEFRSHNTGDPFISSSWRSWAYPEVLYREALSYEALDDVPHARERVDRLLRLWNDADPDQPLLAEARLLEKRLRAAR